MTGVQTCALPIWLFAGTILAEVEFPTIEAANSYSAPSWFIDDVTNDPAYHNSNMSRKVF